MGLRDIPFWTRVMGMLANTGIDRLGARRCATRGHKWRDVGAIVLRQDGGVDELARGAARRCARCGAVEQKVQV